MKEIRDAVVMYHGRTVGRLAETKQGQVAFQYDNQWLVEGFSIRPFSLPLSDKVFLPRSLDLDGLFGVFADSLPDGWGRLLVDRMLLSMNLPPAEIGPVQRLGIVGASGMGALEYVPQLIQGDENDSLDFDRIARECEKILREENSDDLDALFRLGGSSGGARPKVLTTYRNAPWIVKFPSSYDRSTIGEEEYRYMLCAKECGIEVPEIHLLPSSICSGYYGVKRFDRRDNEKIHMVTVSGLLETSHQIPNLDYNDLMKLTYLLTKDYSQMEEMFRRMCFNVFAHNRDDHSKNFSYFYDETEARWKLTPAYDLTYSSSIGGEHAICINGNGKNPGRKDLIAVGRNAGLPPKQLEKTVKEIQDIVEESLGAILHSYKK